MKSSIIKRLKITKRGKILRRACGQSHFRANKRTTQLKRRKNMRTLYLGRKIVIKSA